MKNFLKILFVLVASAGIVCYAYYGIHGKLPINEVAPETTVTKAPATEKFGNKLLISSIPGDDIYLYKVGNNVLLTVDSKQFEFDNWSSDIDAVEPQIFYENFDEDDENEIVIKAVEYKSNKDFVYCVYYLDPVMKNGKLKDFDVSFMNRSTWVGILDSLLVEEVSQLKTSSKIVQFTMNHKSIGITYDKNTGLATNGYSGYFSALQDKNGKYLTIADWDMGIGEYTVSADNCIFVDIPITVSYKETKDVQLAGKIHFQLEKSNKGNIVVSQKSLVFVPNSDYLVSSQENYAREPWSYTERNSDSIVDEDDTNLDWIKYKTAFDHSITTQTISYSSATTDIKNCSMLTVTESYVEIVAKPGCKFSNSANKGEFSVIINEGKNNQFDISYTAEISTDKKGVETLRINFDKKYTKGEISTLTVNYGAK